MSGLDYALRVTTPSIPGIQTRARPTGENYVVAEPTRSGVLQ